MRKTKTVDFTLTCMGDDAVLLSAAAWRRIERFLKTHGFEITKKEPRT
jgi:hypothetical protein